MMLRFLSAGEMVTVSDRMLNPAQRCYQLMVKMPPVAPLLPGLKTVHQRLFSMQPQKKSAAAAAQIKQLLGLDADHDTCVRGLIAFTQALQHQTDDPAEKEAWASLQQTLFPVVASVIIRSYADEAGQAKLAAARLTDADKKRCKATLLTTPTGKETLMAWVERYFASADKLGVAASTSLIPDTGPKSADLLRARNQWIRTVSAILAVLDLPTETPAEAALVAELDRELRAPLRELERRTAGRRAVPDEDPEPVPVPLPVAKEAEKTP